MRMHAQTAMIENGFVHLPKDAAWLAEYLHELTIFPNGKHDDQVELDRPDARLVQAAAAAPAPTPGSGNCTNSTKPNRRAPRRRGPNRYR